MRPILSTKLKNRIRNLNPNLTVSLKNVRINGEAMGCTGFVVDPGTNHTVYVSTDHNHGTSTEVLYRTAKHTKDYTGGRNRYCSYDADEAAYCINDLLIHMAQGHDVR